MCWSVKNLTRKSITPPMSLKRAYRVIKQFFNSYISQIFPVARSQDRFIGIIKRKMNSSDACHFFLLVRDFILHKTCNYKVYSFIFGEEISSFCSKKIKRYIAK